MALAERRHEREKRVKVWEQRLLRREVAALFPAGLPVPSMALSVEAARARALKLARKRARTPDPLGACPCCHRRREQYGPKPQELRQALRAFDAEMEAA